MSKKSTHRYAVIIDSMIKPGLAVNAATHLAVQFGALRPDIAGSPATDADGVAHSGLPIFPNIILSVGPDQMCELVNAWRKMPASDGLIVLDYPEQGFTTNTDQDYKQQISARPSRDIRCFALLIYGERTRVDKLTRGLSLWPAAVPTSA